MSEEMNSINEEDFQGRYDKMIKDLQTQNGWSPRKCRRYLDSMAKKKVKQLMKGK